MKRKILLKIAEYINNKYGVVAQLTFVGDKGKAQIHTTYTVYKPEKDTLVIDWNNKEMHTFGKQTIGQSHYGK